MNLIARLACFASLFLATATVSGAAPIDTSTLEAFDCPDADFADVEATCGYLNLNERADGTGRQIKIAVVVTVPSDPNRASATPTVLIHGGPGVGIVADWSGYAAEAYASTGPTIFFDQRGVGMSSPKLCAWLDEDDPSMDRQSIEESITQAKNDVTRCIAELRKDNVDFDAYGTDVTVRDMESIRSALKIDKWNLLGVSYGTTVGLAYLAAHPDRVRAAVLDSVYPPEVPGFSSMVPATVASLDQLTAFCAAQPECRTAFGDLRVAVEDAVRTLNAQPLRVRSQFDPAERYLASTTFYGILQSQLMDAYGWYVVPRFVDDVRHRRASPLVNNLFDTMLSASADTGVWLATECRERAPFDRPVKSPTNAWPELARAAGADAWTDICATWPAKLPQNWQTPRNVTVPTLLVAGTLDPATPATDAAVTAKLLGPRAETIFVQNAAHSSGTTVPCMKTTIAIFLRSGANFGIPCAAPQPVMAIDLINVDATAVAADLLDAGATTAGSVILLAVVGFFAALLWPLGLLSGRPSPTGGSFWSRSSFWLTCAAAVFAVWLWLGIEAFRRAGHARDYWLIYGMPLEAWPAFSLILVAVTAGGLGLVALVAELRRGGLALLPAVHRLSVATALGLAATAIWQSSLLPHSLNQVSADVQRTTDLVQHNLETLVAP